MGSQSNPRHHGCVGTVTADNSKPIQRAKGSKAQAETPEILDADFDDDGAAELPVKTESENY
jgi:hypothetical protein